MKILYIASNPAQADPLEIEQEINLLREKLDSAGIAKQVDLRIYSNLRVDDLPDVIARVRPDVLHFAAHGKDDAIILAHEQRGHVALDGAKLAAILGALSVRPKLILLNACESAAMAQAVAAQADFVIGTDAPVSNVGARSMAATLYGMLARGVSLGQSFAAARAMLGVVDEGRVEAALFPADAAELADRTQLSDPLRIIACFPRIDAALKQGQTAPPHLFNPLMPSVEFGIVGAPASTRSLQLVTDDNEVQPEKDETLFDARGWMIEGQPVHGEMWIEDPYEVYGDMYWYASVITSERDIHCASATTAEALKRYYFDESWRGPLPKKIAEAIRQAIANLTGNNGARRHRGSGRA